MTMCAQHQDFLAAIIVLLSLLRASHGAETAVPLMPYGNSDQQVFECQQQQECGIALDRNNNETSSTPPRDVDAFYAWDLNEDSLMNALYPDLTRLQAAYEVHPLLSKVSFTTQPRLSKTQPLNSIPTIFHNRTSVLKYENDPILSLFSIDDALEVVAHPHMTHGSDYKLVKKVVRENEWEGMLPEHHYSVDELIKYVQTEGLSLVINDMQHRWGSIGRMTRRMAQELGVGNLNVNLYLTPEVRLDENNMKKNGVARQAFPPHWDMMDVFIIQLAGRKRWSVAREPTVYLSNRDTKRNPTNEEVKHFAQENQFLEFTLCPGDVLYIPRGHMHNASTVVFDQIKRKWEDWDTCPTYPKDLAGADPLGGRLDVPSLHLTFGCNNDFTVEWLVHYALYSYFADDGSSSTRYNKNSVVIPAGTCSASPAQKAMAYDVTWEFILHHSLAELTRRESNCDNPSYRGIPVKQRRECGATATLRQGVPFLLLTNNELDLSSSDAPKQERLQNLESTYLEALDVLLSSSSLHKTIDFIQTHILQLSSGQGGAFNFPGYQKEKHAILCPQALETLQEVELLHRLEDFVQFAKINFFKALERMNFDGKMGREMDGMQQQLYLERVGQGAD